MSVKVGGERQCISLDTNTVRKISVRSFETDEFDIIDDYYEFGNQTLTEAAALQHIHSEAPRIVKKFFPKFYQLKQVRLVKETYSSQKLESEGYSLHWDTNLKEVRDYPNARLKYEWVLDVEKVIAFEDFNLSYQKRFFKKTNDFKYFATYHRASRLEVLILEHWLKENIHPKHIKKLDYQNVSSNWGINPKTGYPQILDLGYFVFKEGDEK